jgi:hypothetical protein
MCLSKRLVDVLGWNVFGLAEDVEQHARLLRIGVSVAFAREAVVIGAAPQSLAGAREQHRRWEAGRLAAARQTALPLLLDGVRRHSLAAADAAIELIVPPLSILTAALVTLLLAGLLLESRAVTAAAGVGAGCLLLYVGAGLVLQDLGWRQTLSGLISLPVFALWKIGVYTQALISRPTRWEATQRDEDAPLPSPALPGTNADQRD